MSKSATRKKRRPGMIVAFKGKSAVKPKKQKYKHSRPEYLTKEYQMFVRQVKERDGMKCQFPGCKRYKFGMEVHHIIRWNDAPALRYSVSNGILLCGGAKGCHKKVTGNELIWAPLFMQIVQQNTLKQQEKKAKGY